MNVLLLYSNFTQKTKGIANLKMHLNQSETRSVKLLLVNITENILIVIN